jgi:S-DNA-T family DNA segregation ATPase FtsK/SpoIIIE
MAKHKDTTANRVTGEIEVPKGFEDLHVPSRRHEVLGVLAGLVALILLLSLVSYGGVGADGTFEAGGNLIGLAGGWVAYFTFSLLGLAIYLVNLAIFVHAACLFVGRAARLRARGIIGALVVGLLSAVALHAFLHGRTVLGHPPGGFLGEVLGELSLSLVSAAGTYILTLGGIAVTLLLVTDISLFLVLRAAVILARRTAALSGRFAARVVRAWRQGQPDEAPFAEPLIVVPDCPEPVLAPPAAVEAADAGEPIIVTKSKKERGKGAKALDIQLARVRQGDFQLPPISLLEQPEARSVGIDRGYLKGMAERLVRVLTDFGIQGEVREIHPGPVVTMFEFQPGSGTRLSKIEGLSSEVAMALEVKRVRVVAPIPGKNAVGFELPNRDRETVRLREIVEDPAFTSPKAKLPLALGKDISGAPFTVDLAKMPHLLMAGTTGSGKSVAMNSMLLSLLLRHTPADLRLLLIDPKMIEFQPYNEIPHLLLPVVTDMSQANQALKWAVDEMERRYQLFADMGARHLEAYNRKVEKILEGAPDAPRLPPDPDRVAWNERGELVEIETGRDARPPEKLPLIVIAIDELADLMMVAAKDVEISISRLAQKARAAGIHLIVATQRPSTDVVTGLIKANFPARLSCQVSSGIDSRTILLQNGAENLLGNGDMLVLPPGTSDLVRAQGAFVDDGEIKNVVDFLKAQGAPEYDDEILKPREEEGDAIDESEKDEVYDQAVAIVAEARFCSISMLQRKLRIGYNRSARIVEIMEREGVVGPANHQNKREVLISNPAP